MLKVFASPACTRCKVLTSKLDAKNIEYEETFDTAEVERQGFTILPILKKDGEYLEFGEAVKYINSLWGD